MTGTVGAHNGLHSERGARKGEHPGRSRNPVIKVDDLAWLEFQKPDLVRAEAFAHAFGFTTVLRSDDELQLRGTDAGAPCVLIRRGPRSRFVGLAFQAADEADLRRLAKATGASIRALPATIGGTTVDLVDPSGIPVHVVAGTHQFEALPAQTPHTFNFGHELRRANATQRPPREPARVQRLGHVVMQTTTYLQALDWYLDHLGLIVSDFLFFPGQRDRGPTMSFIRCDRGQTPADHHTLAMALGPSNRYVHSAYQVCDLDAPAAGGEYLKDHGYQQSWGSAATSRAARSSTTGATRTASWWSTSATATCSIARWSRAGRRSPPPAWRSGGLPPARTSSAPIPKPFRTRRAR